MTLLMVTPYPPYRDGIGTYAVQEVRRLRAEGRAVEVLSPLPSAAHHHLALGSLRGVLALTKKARHYDATMIQFSPEMFFGACRGPLERVAVWVGLEALAKVTKLEIRQHEIEWGPLRRNPAERLVAARALRAAATVSVHTQGEVDRLTAALGIEADRITLVDHGRHFAKATGETQAEARAELGLHPDRHQFLSIGFLQEHKGFDRAAKAFRAAGLSGQAELHIVGSVRVNHPDLVAHASALQRLAMTIPGVEVHQRYVSDEEFDRWILAADTVVLPYREIWSSSVLERAKMLERPIVAADVGGLGDQAPVGTLFFDDDESLAQCLKERAATSPAILEEADPSSDDPNRPVTSGSEAPATGDGSGWRLDTDAPDRRAIEAQIRSRARSSRRWSRSAAGRDSMAVTLGRPLSDAASDAVEPLLALEPLRRPEPVSARRGVTEVKRTLRRLLNWELEPLAQQVHRLQEASTEALTRLDGALADLGWAGSTAGRGVTVVEDPFVNAAMAGVEPGARVLLVGGGGSHLAAVLTAGGHRLTVVDPADLGEATTGGRSAAGRPPLGLDAGSYQWIIVLSAATTVLGLDGRAWPAALVTALAPGGRLVLAVESPAPGGPDLSIPAELRIIRMQRAVEDQAGGWRVEGDALGADRFERRRLTVMLAEPEGR